MFTDTCKHIYKLVPHCKGSQQHILLIFKEHLPNVQISIKNLDTNSLLWSLAKWPRPSVLNLLRKDQGRSKPVIFPPSQALSSILWEFRLYLTPSGLPLLNKVEHNKRRVEVPLFLTIQFAISIGANLRCQKIWTHQDLTMFNIILSNCQRNKDTSTLCLVCSTLFSRVVVIVCGEL